mmetsp:Transcript_26481/g.58820  ORF Transcript_26481/g.58820 Transcript_26481/m.58820 type:complete len:290 (-) Transcript_26481:155-1024(-)
MRGMQEPPEETGAGHQVEGDHRRRRRLPVSRRQQPHQQDRPDLPRSSSEPATKLGAHAATATSRWWDSDHLSASLPASFGRMDENNNNNNNNNSAGSHVAVQVANDDTKAAATKARSHAQCGPRRGCFAQRYRFCAVTTLSAAVVLSTLLLAGPGRGGGLSVTDAAAAASDPVTVDTVERRDLSLDSNPSTELFEEEHSTSGADNETDAQILEDHAASGADNEQDAQIMEEDTSTGNEGDRKKYHHLRRKRMKRMFIDEKAEQKMLEERMKVHNILERQHLLDKEDELT